MKIRNSITKKVLGLSQIADDSCRFQTTRLGFLSKARPAAPVAPIIPIFVIKNLFLSALSV